MSGPLGPAQTTTVSWWLSAAAGGAPGPAGSGHRPIKTQKLLPGLPSLGSTLQSLQGSCPKQLPWLDWHTTEDMSPTVVTEQAIPGDESAPIRA